MPPFLALALPGMSVQYLLIMEDLQGHELPNDPFDGPESAASKQPPIHFPLVDSKTQAPNQGMAVMPLDFLGDFG